MAVAAKVQNFLARKERARPCPARAPVILDKRTRGPRRKKEHRNPRLPSQFQSAAPARTFFKALASRGRPVAAIEPRGQHSRPDNSCILANLSMQLGRSFAKPWDRREREAASVVGRFDEANKTGCARAVTVNRAGVHPEPVTGTCREGGRCAVRTKNWLVCPTRTLAASLRRAAGVSACRRLAAIKKRLVRDQIGSR